MFERFSDHARSAIVFAQSEALGLNHGYIGAEHLLLGILRQDTTTKIGESIGFQTLNAYSITYFEAHAKVAQIVGMGAEPITASHIPFTPEAKKVMEVALREALQFSHNYIGTEHLLLAMLSLQDDVIMRVLNELNHSFVYPSAKETIRALLAAMPVAAPSSDDSGDNPVLVFRGYTGRMTPALHGVMQRAVELAGGAPLGPEHIAQAMNEA